MKTSIVSLTLLPLLATCIASADVIVFENDNPDLTNVRPGFFYDPDIYYRPPEGLCVYLPASSQPVADVSAPGCVGFMSQEGFTGSIPHRFYVRPEGSNAVARAEDPVVLYHQGNGWTYRTPEVVTPGGS